MPNNLDDLLKDLRKGYFESLAEKRTVLVQNQSDLKVSTTKEIFHKLKGTGGTYGLPQLSEVGAIIEGYCLNNCANNPSLHKQALALGIQAIDLVIQEKPLDIVKIQLLALAKVEKSA